MNWKYESILVSHWSGLKSFFALWLSFALSPVLYSTALCMTDFAVGEFRRQADPAHQENLFQQSDENGDRLV